jgi:hypothetical protein
MEVHWNNRREGPPICFAILRLVTLAASMRAYVVDILTLSRFPAFTNLDRASVLSRSLAEESQQLEDLSHFGSQPRSRRSTVSFIKGFS